MRDKSETRHAGRIAVNIPTRVEVIGQRDVKLHPNLAAVYERVQPARDHVGEQFPAAMRDLSTNGAFLSGMPLPVLSRVAFTFNLDGFGMVEALGYTLWRRRADCEVPRPDGDLVQLTAGFGVLFEAIPLDARERIAELVAATSR